MIAVTMTGADALATRLEKMPEAATQRVAQEIDRLSQELRDRVQRKLSGEVLQRRSGRLAASIDVALTQSGGAIGASLSTDVEYAAIHEYGGTIGARQILPRSARALAFPWRGQQRFFTRVELPTVTMPERSFLRSALDEMAPAIRAAIENAMREAMLE
jgi:phage gpG-like protein